jgi:hypothetical protein
MRRRDRHPLSQIATASMVVYFLGKLVRRVGRWRDRRIAAPVRTEAYRPAPRPSGPLPSRETWRPEPFHPGPGDERASVTGYHRAAPHPPDVAAEPGFTIGGDGSVIRKPTPGVN